MRRYKQRGYAPEQQLQALSQELLQLDARIDEALDDKLLESLLYERLSLYSRMGAVIDRAKRERAAPPQEKEAGEGEFG